MFNKDDIITYLLNAGGIIDTDPAFGYPRVWLKKGSIGYLYHMVDSDLCFVRDTFNTNTNKKEREDTFLYYTVDEFGIDVITKYFY